MAASEGARATVPMPATAARSTSFMSKSPTTPQVCGGAILPAVAPERKRPEALIPSGSLRWSQGVSVDLRDVTGGVDHDPAFNMMLPRAGGGDDFQDCIGDGLRGVSLDVVARARNFPVLPFRG